MRTMTEDCEFERNGHHYPDNTGKYDMPYDSALICLLMPIVHLTIRGGSMFVYSVIAWVLAIGTILAALIICNDKSYIVYLMAYIMGAILISYELKKVRVHQHGLSQQVQQIIQDNEDRSNEANASEMRHMIANVAHDLKTPLSSFLAGIEYIDQVINEVQAKQRLALAHPPSSTPGAIATHPYALSAGDVQDWISSINQCVTNMRNTNSFMLMTINRCIDYTKASKGLKLVPKFETIDLLETLSLPLRCMKDIQNRVNIQLLPIPKEICSHVITDKQWLQENVLCLLSNAVKYSNGGDVTITVQKVLHDGETAILQQKVRSSVKGKSSIIELKGDTGRTRRRSVENNSVSTVVLSHTHTISSELSGTEKYDGLTFRPKSNLPTQEEEDANSYYLRIEVEDHGIGLSDEAMDNLFSPFKQAQRLAGGTGLGLFSLAKRVAELEGKCGCMKRRDGQEGTIFWFIIPYKADRTASTHVPKRRRSSISAHLFSVTLGQDSFPTDNLPSNSSSQCTPNVALASQNLAPITSQGNSGQSSPPGSDRNLNNDADNSHPDANQQGFNSSHQSIVSSNNKSHDSNHGVNEDPLGILLEDVKKLNILLVDDSPAIIKMTGMMLRRNKHTVHTATNGAEAVKIIQDKAQNSNDGSLEMHFDVILMDLQMPVMDGLEATRRIRKLEQATARNSSSLLSKIKHNNVIIGVSANSDEETTQEAYSAGVDAFMTKPFSLDTFYDTFEEIMEQKEEGELLNSLQAATDGK